MKSFTLNLLTLNAAFGETDNEARAEIARILREVAQMLEDDIYTGVCRDANGNRVGTFSTD